MLTIDFWEMTVLSMFARAPKNKQLQHSLKKVYKKMSPTARDIADAMLAISCNNQNKKHKLVIIKVAKELLERGKYASSNQ